MTMISVARLISMAALLLAGVGPTRAENLVDVDIQRLASAPAEPVAQLLAIDGSLVAWGDAGSWRLDANNPSWRRLHGPSDGVVLGVTGDGHAAYLLIGARAEGPLERLESFALDDRRQAVLPALPAPLFSARAAASGSKVWVVGVDGNNRRHFVEMDVGALRPEWLAHAPWSESGDEITSAVEQTGALFITLRNREGRPGRIVQWKADEGWKDRGPASSGLIPGTASAVGQAHVLYLTTECKPSCSVG